MEKEYLLSLCIPTRNRGDVLNHTIDSIVMNPYFSNEVEVVVSDNGSADCTPEIMKEYVKQYDNVKYYREEEFIGMHGNILRTIGLGTGLFLKLNNDYNVFTENGLKYILDALRKYKDSKKLLFFEHIGGDLEIIEDLNIDQIVEREGWRFSWMTSYGFWKEDWDQIEDKSARLETMFIMVGHFMNMLERKGTACVYSAHFSNRYPFQQKQGGYNFFKVHTEGYLSLFKEYYNTGKISKKAYDTLHYKLFCELSPFIMKFLVDEKENYTYELDGWFYYFVKAFGRYPWFYYKMPRIIAKMIKHKIK